MPKQKNQLIKELLLYYGDKGIVVRTTTIAIKITIIIIRRRIITIAIMAVITVLMMTRIEHTCVYILHKKNLITLSQKSTLFCCYYCYYFPLHPKYSFHFT